MPGLAALPAEQIAALLAVTLLGGTLRGFAGFGSSLLIVPAVGLMLGPRVAVVIGTLLEALATAMLVPSSLAHMGHRRVWTMGLASCVAIPLGHLSLLALNPAVSNVAISAAVVVMTVLVWRGAMPALGAQRRADVGVGLVSGFLTGFGSIGGPPRVLYFLADPRAAVYKRADIIGVSGIAQAAAIVSMLGFGLLTLSGAGDAALLAPVFFGGGMLGSRLFRRASDRTYQRVAIAALFVAATTLLGVNVARIAL
ncbi:MAG: sulfite exporter TauE/SafE family protein [Proteobacteria bacterium]|jgi:uncharacterized membrane protein YfcA|nr:sulfite exporter TauE/SafE family protein [Pseudomonadota bacterium]